ncbi:M15 family metallopeptidase [Clostridium chrysemydis]|uniref:M15 family metallopeptidase n=1 Tax=Clostridium chrysemydis TaxID=2665504 RepID=UPI003F34BE0B
MNKKKKIIVSIVSLAVVVILIGVFYGIKEEKNIHKVEAQKPNEEIVEDIKPKSDKEVLELKNKELKKYENIENDYYMMLVNKFNPLKDDFVAKDIVPSGLPFIGGSSNTYMNKEAKVEARKMFNDAKKDGITLLGVSAYRTNAVQTQIYNNNIKTKGLEHTKKYSAAPGTSEHETGLAIDVVSSEHTGLTWDFDKTKAFEWLNDNAYKYGFVLRYPKDKTEVTKYEYEPWHYRFVGLNNAKKMHEGYLCFDEYINWARQNADRLRFEIEELKEKK